MRKIVVQIIFSVLCLSTQAQKVSNIRAEQRGQDIVVLYSLETTTPCEVSLLLSQDNGATWSGPLKNVSGDVGKNTSAGEKLIIWKVLEEREQLVGDRMKFKIHAIEGSRNGTNANSAGVTSIGLLPPSADITVATVIEAYYAANGGKEKLMQIRSVRQDGKMNVMGTSIKIETLKFENKMLRVEMNMGPINISTQIFDGTNLVVMSMGKEVSVDVSDILKARMEADFFVRDHISDYGFSLNLVGSIFRNQREVYVIETLNEKMSVVKTEYFDKISGQLVCSMESKETPEGTIISESNMNEFMEVNGMTFPKSIQVKAGGQLIDINMERTTVNGNLSKKAFKTD